MRTSFVLAFLALVALPGCPKGGGAVGLGGGDQSQFKNLETSPQENFQSGVTYLMNPDKKTGLVDYNTAYQRFLAAANLGAGPKAHYNAGWTAEQLGQLGDAEMHYRKAWEADPAYDTAMLSLARVLEQQGKNGEALGIHKVNVEKNPTNWDLRSDYVSSLVKGQRYEEALAEAQEILRHKKDDPAVYRNLSAMFYAQKNYGMSQLTAEKALSINENDPGIYNNMGVTYLIQGDEPAAIEKFQAAIKLQPQHFESNMNLGWVALNSGDYTLAKTCFEAATTAMPSNLDAKLGLAIAQRGMKDYAAAEDLYNQIIAANPKYEAAYLNAAALHARYTKEFEKAQKILDSYIGVMGGVVPPIVAEQKAEVDRLQAEEAERKRLEAEQKKAEEERQRRNEELLTNMANTISGAKTKLSSNSSCIDPAFAEEVGMVLEQAQQVVDAKEADMAPDMQQMLDAYMPALEEMVAGCGGGAAPAPAPESPEGAPPAEGGETPTP
jgi:tetratricopeptide (TPR) repeat protein